MSWAINCYSPRTCHIFIDDLQLDQRLPQQSSYRTALYSVRYISPLARHANRNFEFNLIFGAYTDLLTPHTMILILIRFHSSLVIGYSSRDPLPASVIFIPPPNSSISQQRIQPNYFLRLMLLLFCSAQRLFFTSFLFSFSSSYLVFFFLSDCASSLLFLELLVLLLVCIVCVLYLSHHKCACSFTS